MTKKQALQDFRENILPEVIKRFGANDKPAKNESWNNYTDALRKGGRITQRQYDTWTNPF